MVDQRKEFSLIPCQDHCQRSHHGKFLTHCKQDIFLCAGLNNLGLELAMTMKIDKNMLSRLKQKAQS